MQDIFNNLLEASLSGSVVILAVIALRLVLKKAPRSVFCLLWLLAGLRLVLPFEIESSFSLQPEYEEVTQSIVQQMEAPPVTSGYADQREEILDTESEILAQSQTPAATQPKTESGTAPAWDWEQTLPYLWLAGVLVLCGISLIRYWKLKGQVREAWLLDNGCWECAGIDTAFVLGFLPPKIYLPTGLSEKDRDFIFSHEKTHIARHDHWWKLLGYIVLAVHWFNPLVWVAYNLLCKDIELACDEHVVKAMSVEQRKAYSAALLSCGSRHARLAACPVAFGESDPRQRILSVLNYRRPTFWVSLAAIAAVVFVAVCLMTSPSVKEPDLSFLNYENAIALAAEEDTVMTIYFESSSIIPCKVGGGELAVYLDNANWRERWFEPGDQSSPGSIEFVIEDEYRITVFDRNFARVKYGEEVRYYSIGWGHYEDAKEMLQAWNASNSESAQQEQGQPTEVELLDRCRAALEEFQSQKVYALVIDRQFSGPDALNDGSTQIWYGSGEDWLRRGLVSGGEPSDEDWYLVKDEKKYSRYIITFENPAHGESSDTGWVEGFQDGEGQVSEPWLRTFDWDAQEITFVEHKTEGNAELIAFTVQGSPHNDEYVEVSQYQVTFVLGGNGELQKVLKNYTETWPMWSNGEETMGIMQVSTTISLHMDAPEDITALIDEKYQEAVGMQ